MHYICDPDKRASNRKKHGLDFEDARGVIESGRTVAFEDNRFDYGEQRYITLGMLGSKVVVLAETDDEVRAISIRQATNDDKAARERFLASVSGLTVRGTGANKILVF